MAGVEPTFSTSHSPSSRRRSRNVPFGATVWITSSLPVTDRTPTVPLSTGTADSASKLATSPAGTAQTLPALGSEIATTSLHWLPCPLSGRVAGGEIGRAHD